VPDSQEGTEIPIGSGGSPGNTTAAFIAGFVAGVAVGVAVTLAIVGGDADEQAASNNQPGITADAGASPSNEPVPQ